MRRITMLIACGSVVASALAQVGGRVVAEGSGEPVAGAVVAAVNPADSTFSAVELTASDGSFSLTDAEPDMGLMLHVEKAGFEDLTLPADRKEMQVSLKPDGTHLAEVTVTASAPGSFKREAGKYVYIPKTLPGEVQTAVDVLKTTPLVDVSDQGVSIFSKGPSIIYINGKLPVEPQESVIAMLRSSKPGAIKRVEVVTDPGAIVSSSYSGGIVNVIMSDPGDGIMGSLYASNGYGMGTFNSTEQLWLGFAKGRFHGMFSATFAYYDRDQRTVTDYHYTSLGYDVTNDTRSKMNLRQYGVSTTLSYDLTSRSNIGMAFATSVSGDNSDITTHAVDTRLEAPTIFTARTHNPMRLPYWGTTAFYNRSFDNATLDLRATYSSLRNKSRTDYLPSDASTYHESNDRKAETASATAKLNWRPSFGRFSFGYNFDYSGLDVTNDLSDVADRFIYHENLNSLYAQYSHSPLDWLSVQLGVRGEHYHSSGHQMVGHESFSRNEWDVVPSATLTFSLPKARQSISLSYSEYVSRPWIDKLNPFRRWTSENTYTVGNPYLKTMRFRDFDLGYSLLNGLNIGTSYSFAPSARNDYVYYDEEGNTVTSTANIGKTKSVGIYANYNSTFWRFLRFRTGIGASYIYKTGILNDNRISGHNWSGNWTCNLSFIIKPAGMKIDVWNSLRTASKGFTENHKLHESLSMSVTKYFANTFSIELYVYNFLHTSFESYYDSQGYSYYTHIKYPEYSFKLSLRYTFGNRNTNSADDIHQSRLSSL